ncbi:toll/interleukin-1 receptor domain-containing protein [Aquimarina sp. D1M17]|uniref:toll/interleukin-1 receptor domain-containing protein n=1 Tax=Aquimarina acroporae TaxID=2937283 RepID=UPI0020BE0500|nr:toll/interleukin-1 receptor domain-containing protein [Aquimarina acroporae]MCK8521452.1 toll/interleukin-1 receptor domain-containing protein [Aquimarina acroporae]
MSILPKYGLLQYRNSVRVYTKPIDESLVLFKEETKAHKVSIFLLHKPDQLEELDSAINFLNNFRVMIYVDWLDQVLEDDKGEAITNLITEKLSENQKFIFLATEEAIHSKWCNWVLRLAKTKIPTEAIVMLPIRSDFDDYGGEEHLSKYPYIHEIEAEKYGVKYPNGDIKELTEWMNS